MIKSFTGKYWFLSNFYPCEISFDGEIYPSVEHAYQAAKTLDKKDREIIRTQKTPGRAKKYGQTVTLRDDWEEIKIGIMTELVHQKFFRNKRLQNLLYETGEQELVEGNTWGDCFWGVCNRKGENHLGKTLMEVRDEIGWTYHDV